MMITSRHRPSASTTPASSTTRAASRMVARLDNAADARGRRRARSRRSRTSSTAAPTGADPSTGDGAGILDADARRAAARGRRLRAAAGRAATACCMCFLPTDDGARAELEALLERNVARRGPALLGWRDVPVDQSTRRRRRPAACAPVRSASCSSAPGPGFERRPGRVRAQALRDPAHRASWPPGPDFYVASSSSRTLNYKGMLISFQLRRLLPRPARRALRRARWRSCTRASRPTRSRAGSSPTPTA